MSCATAKVLYQVSETSGPAFSGPLSRLPAGVKNKGGTTQESRVYKIEIWIRTNVDIRVIVSVARPCQPRDLWALR